nr:LysR family transcriptional regulator [Kineococcus siccus]
MRLLRELSRRGTLAAVARSLSYSPSAVSQQLAQLETEAGVTLLEHVGRGVRLTAQAHLLVGHADAVLERLEQAEADLAASLDEVRGTVRVAAFQSVLHRLVPTALTHLADEHPLLRVEFVQLESTQTVTALLAHDVDLVLGEEHPDQPEPRVPGMHEQDLGHDELRLAVPVSGPLAASGPGGPRRAGTALTDLAAAAWVLDPADTPPGRWARTLCRTAGFEPDVRFETPDLLLHAHLARTGNAVALLPDLLGEQDRPALRLVRLPGRPSRRLFTGVRRGAAHHPVVRAVHDSLVHALRAVQQSTAGSLDPR